LRLPLRGTVALLASLPKPASGLGPRWRPTWRERDRKRISLHGAGVRRCRSCLPPSLAGVLGRPCSGRWHGHRRTGDL